MSIIFTVCRCCFLLCGGAVVVVMRGGGGGGGESVEVVVVALSGGSWSLLGEVWKGGCGFWDSILVSERFAGGSYIKG